MAQPTAALESNGVSTPGSDANDHLAVPGKRKRDLADEGADVKGGDSTLDPDASRRWPAGSQKSLVKSYFDVLKRCAKPAANLGPSWCVSVASC